MKCQITGCNELTERDIVWCRKHRIQMAAAFGFDAQGRWIGPTNQHISALPTERAEE